MAFATRKPFRYVLRRHCQDRVQQCGFVEVQTAQVALDRQRRVQNVTAHQAELVQIAAVTRNAWFSAQPPGDQPIRKSMFDAMLLGCIPVLFDPFGR